MNHNITTTVTVCYDDQPEDVTRKFIVALGEMGFQVEEFKPDAGVLEYEIKPKE